MNDSVTPQGLPRHRVPATAQGSAKKGRCSRFYLMARAGFAAIIGLTLVLPWGAAHAVGTAAGTTISNTATATYNVGGVAAPPITASVQIRVDEIIRVRVTPPASPTNVVSNDSNKVLTFLVTNTGNGTETFTFNVNRALGGDNFDPAVGTAGSIFQDTNNNGVFDAGTDAAIPLVAGVPTLSLTADQVLRVFVVSNIPAALTNGNTGLASLTVVSTTTGAAPAGIGAPPGTILANAGTPSVGGGTVDAVVGAGPGGNADSGADDAGTGTYIVAGVNVTLDKVVLNVINPFGVASGPCNVASPPAGCAAFVPGSTIEYQVTVTVTGNATASATAQAVTVSDNVPANTIWVAGSIRTGPPGAPLARTDIVDGDNASCAGCGNGVGTVIANFGDITIAAGGPPVANVVTYRVSIN